MRLSTALSILSQSLSVSSIAGADRHLKQSVFVPLERHLSTTISAEQGAQRTKRQQSWLAQRRRRRGRRLLGRHNSHLEVLRNDSYLRKPRHEAPACSADVGIIASCGPGEHCIDGYCVEQQDTYSSQRNLILKVQSTADYDDSEVRAADTFCNPESDYFNPDFEEGGLFQSCDCSDGILQTGIGTVTCQYENYCMDDDYFFCSDISLTIDITGTNDFTYQYCYDFEEPYHLYCISGNSAQSECTISINGDECEICTVPNDEHCDYAEYYFFSEFDCSNVGYEFANYGNACDGAYASDFIAKASGYLEWDDFDFDVGGDEGEDGQSNDGESSDGDTEIDNGLVDGGVVDEGSVDGGTDDEGSVDGGDTIALVYTEENLQNLVLNFLGDIQWSDQTQEDWISMTEEYLEDYYSTMGVSDVNVEITIVDVLQSRGNSRLLSDQTDDMITTVIFDQVMSGFVDANEMTMDMMDLAAMPFSNDESTEDFLDVLREIPALEALEAVSAEMDPESDEPSEESTETAGGEKEDSDASDESDSAEDSSAEDSDDDESSGKKTKAPKAPKAGKSQDSERRLHGHSHRKQKLQKSLPVRGRKE